MRLKLVWMSWWSKGINKIALASGAVNRALWLPGSDKEE